MSKTEKEAQITLSLSLEQINLIFAALEQLPYRQVFPTIEAIKGQAIPQIQALDAKEKQV
jgi:hypothetical protein